MRSRGFTLIEVLVALAIVALGMSAVLAALTSAADTVYFLKDKTLAEWIAFNRIAEVRLQRKLPAKGKTDGDVEFAGRKWLWQQEVLPTQVKGMWHIEVSVRPVQEGEKADSGARSQSWYATENGIVSDAVERSFNQASDYGLENAPPPDQNDQ